MHCMTEPALSSGSTAPCISSLPGTVEISPTTKLSESAERMSKRAQNRLKKMLWREETRDEWLAQKKAKRKAKQVAKRALTSQIKASNLNMTDQNVKLVCEDTEKPLKQNEIQVVPQHFIVFDLSFDNLMLEKEKSSLFLQLCRSYGVNKRSKVPVHIILTGVSKESRAKLDKMSVSNWKGVKVYEKHWSELTLSDVPQFPTTVDAVQQVVGEASHDGITNPENLVAKDHFVYLTGDSQSVVSDFVTTSIYIIGGIVDKNRHKNLTLNEAQKHSIRTAKLPIREHCEALKSSTILTCNQIFEIISKYLCVRNEQLSCSTVATDSLGADDIPSADALPDISFDTPITTFSGPIMPANVAWKTACEYVIPPRKRQQ